MATHSSILSERTPWTEEPGRLQSMGSQRVGHDLATEQQQQSVDDQYKFYICEDVYKISLTVIYTFSCREPIFFCLDTFTVYMYTHTHIYIHQPSISAAWRSNRKARKWMKNWKLHIEAHCLCELHMGFWSARSCLGATTQVAKFYVSPDFQGVLG